MVRLTNTIAILSRSNGAARLIAIDVDAKTCIINNGKEKTIKWSSAAEYKLDTGSENTRTLTPKFLTTLHNAENARHVEEAATIDAEAALEPASESQEAAGEITPEETTAATDGTQEAVSGPPKVKRQRTPKGTISDSEKAFLSMIPTQPDFNGVNSIMGARAIIKKMQEVHGLPIPSGRTVFLSLKNKGYYNTKGRESGQALTTFQLSELGIKYLTENNLIA